MKNNGKVLQFNARNQPEMKIGGSEFDILSGLQHELLKIDALIPKYIKQGFIKKTKQCNS